MFHNSNACLLFRNSDKLNHCRSECKFACKSYTIKHKWMTICIVSEMIATGSSILSACHMLMVRQHSFYRWKRVVQDKKDMQPKIAKASHAILVSVMAAPSDANPNPALLQV